MSELESDLSKARKQERAYEDALELLQAELDKAEQDIAALKQARPSGDKGEPGVPFTSLCRAPLTGSELRQSSEQGWPLQASTLPARRAVWRRTTSLSRFVSTLLLPRFQPND